MRTLRLFLIPAVLFLLPSPWHPMAGLVTSAWAGEYDFTPFFEFYSDNRISTAACGKGYTGIASPSSDLTGAVLNPAALMLKGRFQVYGEYVYKSKVPWLKEFWPDIGELSLNPRQPTLCVGIGGRIGNHLQTGLLYYTSQSYKFKQGEIFRTDEQGNILDSANVYTDYQSSTVAVPCAYQFGGKTTLTLGLNLGYATYRSDDNFGFMTGKARFSRIITKFGVVFSQAERLRLGIAYQPEFRQTVTEPWTGMINDTSTYGPMTYPSRIGLGASYRPGHVPLRFSVDYQFANTSRDSVLVNRKDIHLGLEYEFSKTLTLRTGLFTLDDYRSRRTQWLDPVGSYDQKFITLGASYRIGPVTAQTSLMDSHWLSSGKIKETYIHSGVRYDR